MLEPKRKQLKALEGQIKKYMEDQFGADDDRVEITSNNFIWTTSKSTRNTFDAKQLQKDNPSMHTAYMKETETYTLRKKEVEK